MKAQFHNAVRFHAAADHSKLQSERTSDRCNDAVSVTLQADRVEFGNPYAEAGLSYFRPRGGASEIADVKDVTIGGNRTEHLVATSNGHAVNVYETPTYRSPLSGKIFPRTVLPEQVFRSEEGIRDIDMDKAGNLAIALDDKVMLWSKDRGVQTLFATPGGVIETVSFRQNFEDEALAIFTKSADGEPVLHLLDESHYETGLVADYQSEAAIHRQAWNDSLEVMPLFW